MRPSADELAVAAANLVREGEAHAFALADPVGLHGLHALRPARQAGVHALEQFVGVIGDASGSSIGISRFSTGAPERQPRPSTTCSLASTVWSTGSQLTICVRGLLVDDGLEHLEEHPLVPACSSRGRRLRSRGDQSMARPIDSICVLHVRRCSNRGSIAPAARCWLHRRVFRRHAERIPAHRHQHVHSRSCAGSAYITSLIV